MKDNDLRGIVLSFFYEHRRNSRQMLRVSDFPPVISELGFGELRRICKQLEEYGYLKYSVYSTGDAIKTESVVQGQITGAGVDVIEGTARPIIAITIDQSHAVTVSGSSNVQVGNNNSISTLVQVDALNRAIDDSKFAPAEKQEAKTALSKFLEHPVIVAILGGLASNVGKAE